MIKKIIAKLSKYINIEDIKKHFPKFAVVGLSGMAVNQGMLFFTKEYIHIPVKFAGIIAIETSIITNFLLNNFWTWKESRDNTFLQRLLRYHSVTAVSGVVNYLVLLSLTALGIYYILANLIGIGIGMLLNFVFNHIWTFQ